MTRSPNRLHKRTSFFKYMPASTARLVLDNRTLRRISPSLFNDPFDVPRELSFGITCGEIVEALARRFASLIKHPLEDTSGLGIKETSETHQPTGASMEALGDLWRSWIPHIRIYEAAIGMSRTFLFNKIRG